MQLRCFRSLRLASLARHQVRWRRGAPVHGGISPTTPTEPRRLGFVTVVPPVPADASGQDGSSRATLPASMVEERPRYWGLKVRDVAAVKVISRGCRMRWVAAHDPDQRCRSTAAQGIRAVSCSTHFLGWTLCGWVAALMCAVGHRDPNPAAAYCSVIWSMSPMKRCLATFVIAASLFAPVAHANDALEAKLRAYVPVFSLAKVCDITINDATSGDHRAMLEAVKSDPNAEQTRLPPPLRNADGLHQGPRRRSTGRLLQGLHRRQQPIRQGARHRRGRGPHEPRQH